MHPQNQQQPGDKPTDQQQTELGQQQQQRKEQLCQEPAVVSGVHCMVGFVAGSRAEEMSQMSQTSVIMNTLAQLDTMFGKLAFSSLFDTCMPVQVVKANCIHVRLRRIVSNI